MGSRRECLQVAGPEQITVKVWYRKSPIMNTSYFWEVLAPFAGGGFSTVSVARFGRLHTFILCPPHLTLASAPTSVKAPRIYLEKLKGKGKFTRTMASRSTANSCEYRKLQDDTASRCSNKYTTLTPGRWGYIHRPGCLRRKGHKERSLVALKQRENPKERTSV